MPTSSQIDRCFAKPVIPVFWNLAQETENVAHASCVILQGGNATELPSIADKLSAPPLDHLRILVHIDLIAGLEKNEAGLEMLTQLGDFDGIVTVHQHLMKPAKQQGLLSILRVFLTDNRACERGVKVATKAKPDVVELLPAAAAVQVAEEFHATGIPFISGGLCRSEEDIRQALTSGCQAVTSTSPELWKMNG